MVTRKNIINYERVQGQEFVDVIRAQKPIAVHAYRVSSEHDEVYSFSFCDRKNRVHDYMHEIDEYASTVIGTEQLKNFATLYGAPLVGGSVEYHGEERYHFFDSAHAFEYRGFDPAITYKVWQGALENHLDNQNKKALVRAIPGRFEVVVDVTYKKDHFVLKFRPSKRQSLGDVIRDNLQGYEVIDVTPYAAWLKTMRRGD